MQKRFFYFLITFQVILLLAHWILYEALVVFVPSIFSSNTGALQAFLTVMAFAFPVIMGFSMNRNNKLVRLFANLIGIWMPIFFYGFLSSAILWIIFAISEILNVDLPMTAIVSAFFALSVVAIIAGFINARIQRVRKVEIQLPHLPEFWKGKSFVLLTDIHVGHILRQNFVKKIVRMTNALAPEAVFISGDYYDGVRTDTEALAEPLKDLNAPLGTYFVSGNHDSYHDFASHISALKRVGVKVIDGTATMLHGLQLIGEGYNMSESVESVSQFLSSIGVAKDAPSILLKHIPSNLKAAAQAGISLVLCGHTHKGQLWPFNFITYQVFRRYHYDLQKFGEDMLVYTSSGIGTWGSPFRLGTKSELVYITLK